MLNDDLDHVLSSEPEIVPSSGFLVGVMDMVQREASQPPAIPFPWKWAAPGIAAAILAVACLLVSGLSLFLRGALVEPSPSALASTSIAILHGIPGVRAGWIVVALALSLVSVKLPFLLLLNKS